MAFIQQRLDKQAAFIEVPISASVLAKYQMVMYFCKLSVAVADNALYYYSRDS